MAVTKLDILAEEIDLMVSGENSAAGEKQWHRAEIRLLVGQAFNALIRADYNFNAGQEGIHNVGGQYLVEFNGIAVSTDTTRKQKYSVLPSSFVNLPGGKGIAEVYAYDSTIRDTVAIVPLPATSRLLKGLWATALQGGLGYSLEGERAYYSEEGKQMTFSTVNMKIVIGSSGNINADQEILVLQQTLQLMAAKRAEDKVADSNATK